jgi:ABC-type sugar transport system ATPase subunit
MIKIITGVEQPDDGGEIYFNGGYVHKMNAHKSISMGIAAIYQDISLFPNLSIAENICKGMFKGVLVNWNKIRSKARETLKMMNVDLDLNQRLGEVSVGKQQLVAIARAVTFDSKVIIMDEPTSALSPSEVGVLYEIIRKLRESDVSIIYISHKLDEVFMVADTISVLRDGCMIKTGPVADFTQQDLIKLMVGRELRFLPMRNEEPESDEVLFEVKNLTREPQFRNISFCVRKNEIVGITGLVGAGRSEVAQTIFGLMKPDDGTIFINGEKVVVRDANDAIRKGICYLPEDRRTQGLFQGHSMIKNITAVTLHKMLGKNEVHQYPQGACATTEEYIRKVDIRPDLPDISVESLSGGNQQKALISRWLNADPRVLIVDEPTCGIDVGSKLEIHKLLRQLARMGVCVVLISSDLPEVFAISDRILVMREGNLVAEVETHNATQEGILEKGLMG